MERTEPDVDDDYRRRWAVEQAIALLPEGAGVGRILAAARRLEGYASGRRKGKIILINSRKDKTNEQ